MSTQTVPAIRLAADAILAVYNGHSKTAPASLFASPEPCRAIAYWLGYEQYDGTQWWRDVMDIVAA